MSHLVLCYYQAAAVLWQVADGCWIRLTCSCTGSCKPFCLTWWLLDLGGSPVRGKRSLVDELLQALTYGSAEPHLNSLRTEMEWYCDKFERLERCDLCVGRQTCCCGNSEEGLKMGHACNVSFWENTAQGWLFKQQLVSVALPAPAAICPILVRYESWTWWDLKLGCKSKSFLGLVLGWCLGQAQFCLLLHCYF